MVRLLREAVWGLSHRTPHFRGKERMVSWLARPSAFQFSTIQREGVTWQLYGHDLNEFYLAARRSHSEKVSNFLSREIESRGLDRFWDIGANIGGTSLPLLKRFPKLQAVLFEPSAEVAGRLIRNLSCNPDLASRARVMQVALSQADEMTEFFVSNEPHNSGVAGLGKSHNRAGFGVVVAAARADSLVARQLAPKPQLVKMDVEGFEIEVLRGMTELLKSERIPVVFEHSLYRCEERGKSVSEVTDFFRAQSYRVYRLDDGQEVTNADLQKDDDFVARAEN